MMVIILSAVIIFLFSVILAIVSSEKELVVPDEVKKMSVGKKRGLSGVILFMKNKIVHYVSSSEVSE